MWPWRVKMPTQNLLRLLLLLMLVMRIVLATVCCRFGSWGLVIKLNFCSDFGHFGQDFLKLKFRRDFEAEVWSAFCRWCFEEVKSWILVNILKLGLVKFSTLDCVEMLMFSWDFEVNAYISILSLDPKLQFNWTTLRYTSPNIFLLILLLHK